MLLLVIRIVDVVGVVDTVANDWYNLEFIMPATGIRVCMCVCFLFCFFALGKRDVDALFHSMGVLLERC